MSDDDRNKGYLPGRLRIAAGTVNFNDSRVLAKCLTDAADEIERLIQRVRELEEGLSEALDLYPPYVEHLEALLPPDKRSR